MNREEFKIDGDIEVKLKADILVSKFRNFVKEHFQFETNAEPTYLELIRESARFYHFNLPEELSELFIRYEVAPLFWIYESPMINYLEEFFKLNVYKGSALDYQKFIKEFFTKWVIIKSDSEKKYFASSAANFIEKDTNKYNFLNHILYAVILCYDNSLYNPTKAIEELKKAKEILALVKLNEKYSKELYYLTDIYTGFAYMKIGDTPNAVQCFSDALAVKSWGITAKFYEAFNQIDVNNNESGYKLAAILFEYDLKRLQHAIEYNNLTKFKFFLRNPVIGNLFFKEDLAYLVDSLELLVAEVKRDNEVTIHPIQNFLLDFKNLRMMEYYNERIEKNLMFLDKYIEDYLGVSNLLVQATVKKVAEKFKETVQIIISTVQNKYMQTIKERLKYYDNEIIENSTAQDHLIKELEKVEEKVKVELSASIQKTEQSTAHNVAVLEDKIKKLDQMTKYNPEVAFKNTMSYNIVLSLSVFLVGGFAVYSNSYITQMSEFKNIVSLIIISGAKWGIITFIIGFVIALIISGSVMLEKSSQKQKLMQLISGVKNEKERTIERLKKEYEELVKRKKKNFTEKIEMHKKRVEDLKGEKERQEASLVQEASALIGAETEKLQVFL